MEHYAPTNHSNVPLDKEASLDEEQIVLDNVYSATEEHMMAILTMQELEMALASLKEKEITRKGWDNERNADGTEQDSKAEIT